jgi:hypothetical protein
MSARVVIACRVMQEELTEALNGDARVEVIYLDQALHRTPQKMAALVQEQIDKVSGRASEIVLSYGLCSNGIAGVVARDQGLVIPRCHDCIALLMGSLTEYKKRFEERPGTYYLSRGWLAEKKDPLSIVEGEYTERVGREAAVWVMQEELKHYTHISLIRCGKTEMGPLIERARQNAEFFGKEYEEIHGNFGFFERILFEPCDGEDFLVVPPGGLITQEMFMSE